MAAKDDKQGVDLRALSTSFSFRRQGLNPEKYELNVEKKKISHTANWVARMKRAITNFERGRGMKKRKKTTHNYRVEASTYMTQSLARSRDASSFGKLILRQAQDEGSLNGPHPEAVEGRARRSMSLRNHVSAKAANRRQ